MHLIDIENLLGEAHATAGVLEIAGVINAYYEVVDAQRHDQVYFGVNASEMVLRVHEATDRGSIRCRGGKDGADFALLGLVDVQRVIDRFDRVCIASGDHAFSELAHELTARGVNVTVVARPLSLSWELYRASSEHLTMS
jgi:hypothetical protein